MPTLIRPPDKDDKTRFLRMLFLRTERRLIAEINHKRINGYVDYAEVAALKRTQQILQEMVDESWNYVPTMIESIFYRSEAAANGYANAAGLTALWSSCLTICWGTLWKRQLPRKRRLRKCFRLVGSRRGHFGILLCKL